MSGAFPISTAKFESLGIKSIQNTIISKSQSGKKLARQIDGQRFGFTVRIITGTRSDVYGELMAFIIKQRSGKENFTITPPEIKNAIVQVNNYQKQVNNLTADLQNCKIIIAHHSNYIKENVPAAAEIDEPKAETTEQK